MATRRHRPPVGSYHDMVHAWSMGEAFSEAAWLSLTTAANGLMDSPVTFGPAPRPALRNAPLIFSISCTAETITLRGGGFMRLGECNLWLGGEPLMIRRGPGWTHDAINTGGRPYDPVVRAVLLLAARFGNGFRISDSAASEAAWRDTGRLITLLFAVDELQHQPLAMEAGLLPAR